MKSFLLQLIVLNLLFISLNCSFQLSLFNELNKSNRGKNLILSPLSVFQILSLTANGARNETQSEMIEALQNADIDTLNAINYEILEAVQEFTTVEMANAVMSKFDPLQEFMDISETYCAPLEKLISVEQVNNWCSEKTHGKITKILSQLDATVQMILLNAVYFKGEWSSKFKERLTSKKIFYNLGNEVISVDTMNQISHFNYYQDDEIQAIELPYNKDGMTALNGIGSLFVVSEERAPQLHQPRAHPLRNLFVLYGCHTPYKRQSPHHVECRVEDLTLFNKFGKGTLKNSPAADQFSSEARCQKGHTSA